MISDKQLKEIFFAFRNKDDSNFLRIAESIISNKLAANEHNLANELKKIIGLSNGTAKSINKFGILPKERRNGEPLISFYDSKITSEKIVLDNSTFKKIDNLLKEHRNKSKLFKYGYTPKTKILFWGLPGTGKTYTAHYIANELGVPLGIIRLNTIISSFLGDTASHLQKVFDTAKNNPMVLLLDEVDAVAKNRDDKNDVGELKRVVNSLLQAMDSFNTSDSVIICASNHQYLLDPAIWRRFDNIIHFPFPKQNSREKYLKMLTNGITCKGSLTSLSKQMTKISFADIEKIVVESIKEMILSNKNELKTKDILTQYNFYISELTNATRG